MMLTPLRTWLAKLPFRDRVQYAQALVLQLLIGALILSRLVFIGYALLLPNEAPAGQGILLNLVVIMALLIILSVLRRGHLELATLALIGMIIMVVTQTIAEGGFTSSGIIAVAYMVVIALAGLLLARGALIMVTAICCTMLFFIALGATRPGVPTFAEAIFFSMVASAFALLIDRYRSTWEQVVETAQADAERLRLALDAGGMGSWDWDLRSDLIIWDGHHERIVGIPEGTFDGRFATFARMVHPDDLPKLVAGVDRSREQLLPFSEEYRVVWPDGTVRWTIGRGRFLTDRHQKPIRMLGVLNDITERKQNELRIGAALSEIHELNADLERRVTERTAELAAKNHELEVFAYSVSHDLKAPLRGIDGYSRLLQEDFAAKLDGDGPYYLEMIRTAAARMGQLIDDLLAYSRVERRTLNLTGVQLQRVITEVIETHADLIAANQITVQLEVEALIVQAEEQSLAQTMRNLFENALKFSRDQPAPQIELGARREDADYALIWIRDNGIGFSMEYHDKIFSLFQRLHRAEDYPGTGIGLAIVRKAIERSGGTVWAESSPGAGATFFVRLPLVAE